MQCIDGKLIKEEHMECDIRNERTVVISEQKVILAPRVEIHRVMKPPSVHDTDSLPPPQVVFTSRSSNGQGQSQQVPQQRVQVIKDGRCYEESSNRQYHTNSDTNMAIVVQPNHGSHVTEPKKFVLSRQVNVISNVVDRDINGTVFRPPVVSSTSTPMRPPPPPPPPKSKGVSPEEPSSSIPDLDIQLAGRTDQPISSRNKVSKSTDDLVFAVGKSNPAVFLKEFEECDDAKTDNDKLYKIRNFVNLEHKRVFSELFFKNDWSTARSTFLKMYSLVFTANKKRELDFTFNEETSVRSFVNRKMMVLSMYTRLSVQNQLEIILNELPVEVSNLFILHDKMNCTKTDILQFCDTIQELMEPDDEYDKNATLQANPIGQNEIIQDLEVFNYEPQVASQVSSSEVETSDLEKTAGGRKHLVAKSTKRSRTARLSDRPSKIKRVLCNGDDDDDDDQSTTSSCSNF